MTPSTSPRYADRRVVTQSDTLLLLARIGTDYLDTPCPLPLKASCDHRETENLALAFLSPLLSI